MLLAPAHRPGLAILANAWPPRSAMRSAVLNVAGPATAHQVHRTIRTALGEAVRRRQVQENVATLAKAPKIEAEELEPYSVAEVQRILSAARERRNAARWAIALSLGLRQGDVLGLRWSDVDLEAGILKITSNRVRPHYEHGCSPPCGKTVLAVCKPTRTTDPPSPVLASGRSDCRPARPAPTRSPPRTRSGTG
jgi:integrase